MPRMAKRKKRTKADRRAARRQKREKWLLDLKSMSYGQYLKTRHWQGMRKQALARADNKCEICGSDRFLNVHHEIYRGRGKEKLSDLKVLCSGCHCNEHEGEVDGVFDPMTREFMELVSSF